MQTYLLLILLIFTIVSHFCCFHLTKYKNLIITFLINIEFTFNKFSISNQNFIHDLCISSFKINISKIIGKTTEAKYT